MLQGPGEVISFPPSHTVQSMIDQAELSRATHNDPASLFTLSNANTGESREFEIKDLEYDAYIQFVDLARPILAAVAGIVETADEGGEFKVRFNPTKIDFGELIKLAGSELPQMAHIICRQSDPKIRLEDVKRLGRRPHVLLEVVLQQIKQNGIVTEFADFFPRIAEAVKDLMPQVQTAMVPAETAPTA